MTPFKERMNLYRAYRELNPDKNYWDWKASIDNAGKLAQQFRTSTNKPNFVQRLEDPNRQTIPSWEDDTSVATHRLSYATYDDGSAITYPEVQQIGNKLYDFTDPTNRQTRRDAYQSALNRGDFVWVPTEQDAIDFTTQYKNHYPTFSKGSPEVPAMRGEDNTEDYQPTSEIPTYWDEESQSFKSGPPRVIGMSGTDPIGEAYVTGKAFTKALDIIGDAYRWKRRTDAINDYRDWLRSSEWNRSSNAGAKSMRELLKDGYRKHGGDGDIFSEFANDVANAVLNGVKSGEKLLGFENGGVIPAMQNGGENKPLQDPTIKTITFPDGSTIQTLLPWANQQGLLNTPVADMFNPANDVYDVVQVGKDATEGNWAGVGAGLALAMVPNAIEKPLRAVGRGIKKRLVKNVDERVATVLPEPTTTAIARDVYAKDVHNYYIDDVFPRMINNQGVHNSWIEYYAKNPDNFLYNVQPNTYFRNKNVSGRYTSITDEVALNEDFANTIHQKPTLVHENRHRLDSSIELTDQQTDLLRLAYKAQTGTSAADMREMVATNTEIRSIIYDAFDDGSGKLTPEFINNRIDAMPDYDLLDLVENVNVYGNQYSKNLRNQDGTINKKAIQNVRNALKYVPALAAPMMIYNTEDKSN